VDSYRTAGRVADGKLDLDRARLKAALASMGDGPVVVTVARQKSKRSIQANAYYHGVVVKMIADETGQDVESVHEFLKREVNAQHVEMVNKATGEVYESWVGGSTSDLNVGDFYSFVERARAWAGQFLGLEIPDPV
jgi:hypothetical protein